MAKKELVLMVGERMAQLLCQDFPVFEDTEIVRLVRESGERNQAHYDISMWRIREGGYQYPLPVESNISDISPIAPSPEWVNVGKFQEYAVDGRTLFAAYTSKPRRMLFIA